MNCNPLFGLHSDHLCPVFPGHFLTEKTKNAFLQMQKAALSNQIDLTLASSFRSFERQRLIWNRKFSGESPVFDYDGSKIAHWSELSDLQKCISILRWSALPGASRHHWGTDLDVYSKNKLPLGYQLQLIPEEYCEQGIFHELTTWLDQNMVNFGFYRPYALDLGGVSAESWHLSFYPESSELLKQISPVQLLNIYEKYPIAGLTAITNNIDMLWQRFILNIQEPPQ